MLLRVSSAELTEWTALYTLEAEEKAALAEDQKKGRDL